MQKKHLKFFVLALFTFAFISYGPAVFADTIGPINFEPTTYVVGNINGQDGWLKTGAYDVNVSATAIPSGFGTQSMQISDAVTSGAFGDQAFAKPLTDSVGETSATAGTFSAGTKQTHFETQFDIASTMPDAQQPGMHLSVSPDRGDGSRMSYLRFEDQTDGIHVFFDDVTDAGPLGTVANFNETDIATISRTPHTIKLTMDVVDGPSNDVVKVYIDGLLVHTGTSWEDYYRFDPEASAEQSPRIVKTVEFRESGAATPADLGKGFLIDNFSQLSSTPTPACNANATQAVVSDTLTFDLTDGHAAATVTPHPAWASISGSTWVYSDALDVNGSSPTGTKTFTRTFSIVGTPKDSSLEVGADNMYTVSVNGNPLTTGTSATDLNNFNPTHTWTIPAAYLFSGSNTITFVVTNPAADPVTGALYGNPNPGGLIFKITVNNDECAIPQPQIHIFKYVDGGVATAVGTNSAVFPMLTSWTSSGPNGNVVDVPFTLNPTGWGATDSAYEASYVGGVPGDNYATHEVTGGAVVGASCDTGQPFALAGYSVGSTLLLAQGATQTLTIPNITNLQSDQYVIVWNKTCPAGGTISGMKYNDLNRNGKQDTAEPGLSGWTIKLFSDDAKDNDVLVASTVTDANGNYTFANVAPGTYEIRETHQKGWKRMSKNPKDIVITAGSVVTSVTFGNATVKKGEKEDTDNDDHRDDQSGKYFGNHGRSNYGKEQDNKDHQQPDNNHDNGRGNNQH